VGDAEAKANVRYAALAPSGSDLLLTAPHSPSGGAGPFDVGPAIAPMFGSWGGPVNSPAGRPRPPMGQAGRRTPP
jgi:hypothetical protein